MSLKIGTKVKIISINSDTCEVVRIDNINGVNWYKLKCNGYVISNVFSGVELEVVE